MGLISWISDLFKQPESWQNKSEALTVDVDIAGPGNFEFEIVGESNYQTRIWAMIPTSDDEKIRVYFIASIELEDDNEHDDKAVAVSIDRRIVGHLSRADARAYRKWLAASELSGSLTCHAVIVGGKGKSYGVWLDTPFDNK